MLSNLTFHQASQHEVQSVVSKSVEKWAAQEKQKNPPTEKGKGKGRAIP